MSEATIEFEDGRVILRFSDGSGAKLPTTVQLPPEANGQKCFYKKKRGVPIIIIHEGTGSISFDRDSVEMIKSKIETGRVIAGEREKRQQEALKAAQERFARKAEANIQSALENGRAHFFSECLAALSSQQSKAYSDISKQTWILVRKHSIGPAIAFLEYQINKGKDNAQIYEKIYEHLKTWFQHESCMLEPKPQSSTSFLRFITENLSSESYRGYTREALECLQWAGVFAMANSKDSKKLKDEK